MSVKNARLSSLCTMYFKSVTMIFFFQIILILLAVSSIYMERHCLDSLEYDTMYVKSRFDGTCPFLSFHIFFVYLFDHYLTQLFISKWPVYFKLMRNLTTLCNFIKLQWNIVVKCIFSQFKPFFWMSTFHMKTILLGK